MTEKRSPSWHNKPQTNATIPGGIIFFSAGMNLAFSVGWAKFSMLGSTHHFCYSWFFGVIAGTLISIPLRDIITKKVLWILSSMFVLSSGIIFTIVPDNYEALLAGRYLNGFAVGLATLPFVIHASEIAVDSYRGRCLAVEQFCVSMGVALQMIYSSNWGSTKTFSIYSLHGIFDIVLAILALLSLMFFVESPIDYIRRDNDHAAYDILTRLLRPKDNSQAAHEWLQRSKIYVAEEESLSSKTSFLRGLLPLGKMVLYRSLMLALFFSLPLNAGFQYSATVNSTSWAPTVAALGRILGASFALYLVNDVGRKMSPLMAMLIAGGLLVGLGPLFNNLSSFVDSSNMATATYLYTCMQFAVGYFTPFSSIYLGEAFPLKVKPFLVAICVIAEQIVHIILISTISVDLSLMTQGIVVVVVFILLCFTIPETRNTSLQEAQRRFRQFWDVNLK